MAGSIVEGKAKVTLDGAEAGAQLKKLETTAQELKRTLIDLKSQTLMDNQKIKDTEGALKKVNSEMKAVKDSAISYQKTLSNLSGASLKELEQAAKKLSAETKVLARNTDEYKQKAGDLSKIRGEIEKVKGEMKAVGVETQTFGSRLKSIGSDMMAATGIVGGFYALISVVKNAFNTIKEFGKGVSELQAITGASGKDLDYLKQKAKELAVVYGTSATEIVNAMKMVGSAKPELLENVGALAMVTDAVLTLSKASSMDLATTTESLTTIMNQFGHGASMAAEDINILAAGSKFGAVEVDYLGQAISKVGTVAASAGLSLQQTTAAMELFGEKGIKAEIAGTGFKSVLVKLQADTKNYTNGVFDLNKAIENNQSISKDNIALQEKFGKEYFNLAQILLQGKDRFNELTTQVTGTNTAFEQAAIATNNLSGDMDKAKSSWDSFILSTEDGSGIISQAIRHVVQSYTDLLTQLEILNSKDSTFLDKTESSFRIIGKLIPGMGTAIDNFKKSWNDVFNDGGIILTDKQIADAKARGTQAALDEIANKKLANEEIKKINEEITADEQKAREEKAAANKAAYDQMLADTQALNESIMQMSTDLITDAQTKAEAEIDIWYKKEQQKIKISKASKETKDRAILVLDEAYEIKQKELDDKFLQASLDQQIIIDAKFNEQIAKHDAEVLKAEKDKADAIITTREKYGLIPLQEQHKAELAELQNSLNNQLITNEEFKKAESEINKKYRDLEKEEFKGLQEEKFKEVENFAQTAQVILGSMGNFISSLKEKELQDAGDNEEKKKQIMKKYADIELAVKIGQIISSTALAIMQALAQLGPIAGAIAAVTIGVTGVAQLAMAVDERNKIKGLASGGKFGVTRAQDGRNFNAEYGGGGHGYYDRPTVLVAEEGPEFVVSNKALQVPAFKRAVDAIDIYQQGISGRQVNYRGLLQANKTVGLADGGFTPNNNNTQSSQFDNSLLLAYMASNNELLNEIRNWQKDQKVYVLLDDIETATDSLNSIKADVRL